MIVQITGKKLISTFVLAFTLSVITSQAAVAEDTKTLVYKVCTECHDAKKDPKTGKLYWEGIKKTKKEWAKAVDKMQMWGAQLTDQEADLVVEYLTAAGNKNIPTPTTTTTVKAKTTTTQKAGDDIKATKTAITTIPTTTTTLPPAPETTLPPATVAPVTTLPAEQAKTGVEMIWYLLGGGTMVGSGMALRNRDKQLVKDDSDDI